jgi:NosR/NirI family nitrous oxide reductase transcriptional regulator
MLFNIFSYHTYHLSKLFLKLTLLSFCVVLPAHALFVSPAKDPLPLIKEILPTQTKISDKNAKNENTRPI